VKPPKARPYDTQEYKKAKGLIIVYTGDGKGKTTAALGLAMRAAGCKKKVLMVQFMKGTWKYGELDAAQKLKPYLEIKAIGTGFTWDTKNRALDIQNANKIWQLGKKAILSGKFDVVILDEINYVLDYKFISLKDVLSTLKKKRFMQHVVLTGRNASPKLIQQADLVTEMREIKHPFKDQKILAQRGIDF
jgi:cob(I)alamin adenosyltransferase